MRNGFEKEVAVYCMRPVKAASPHPQVGDERNATRTKAVAATATSTTMATIWIPVPVLATLSKFPPGVSISVTRHSGRITIIGMMPIAIQTTARIVGAASIETGTGVGHSGSAVR